MSAASLLAELHRRGVELRSEGDHILYRPREAVPPQLRAKLQKHRQELLSLLRRTEVAPPLLNTDRSLPRDRGRDFERFLEDTSIPAAVFHSRGLGRHFVLARDPADVDALERTGLPVIYFRECAKPQHLAPADLGRILDVRAVFGPAVSLATVEAGNAWARTGAVHRARRGREGLRMRPDLEQALRISQQVARLRRAQRGVDHRRLEPERLA